MVLCLTASLQAGEILYGITADDNLITIDPTTGQGTLVGALELGGSPIAIGAVGLAVSGGNLYAYDSNNNLLRQIDPATGNIINTVDLGIGVSVGGSGNLAFSSSGAGVIGSTLDDTGSFGTGTLYSMSTSPGSAAVVNNNFGFFDGLAFNSGNTLYGLDQGGDTLSTIDPTNGNTTTVGGTGITTIDPSSGFPIYGLGGLAFDSGGTLFGELANFDPSNPLANLYTINTTTGAATLVGAIGIPEVDGIAFLSTTSSVTTPEPSTFALAGGVLVLAGILWRRRGFLSLPTSEVT
jgi:uncharacterized protein (TIGR03382 family)